MSSRNRNELWGRALVDELARCGLRHVVVSPGSRSTPLVLAAASDSRLQVTPQVDERSAGFLGLGVGKITGAPAAVVTTSGTAVANLLPAVVEAAQSETPLLILTADRPPWLRGADANQTIEQRGIFGGYVRLFEELSPSEVSERTLRHLRSVACRATAAALGDPAGPVHLNLPFAKPLEPSVVPGDLPAELAEGRTPGSSGRAAGKPWTQVRAMRAGPTDADLTALLDALDGCQAPVLVAGVVPRPWEVGPVIRRAARVLGVPLLADALSGARYYESGGGDEPVVGGYDLALSSPALRESLRPDLVIRIGSPPTSAMLGRWLRSLEDVEHFVISGGGRWKDHLAVATRVIAADPVRFLEELVQESEASRRSKRSSSLWSEVEADVRAQVSRIALGSHFEGGIVADLVARVDPGDVLFVSNSMPVRDLDTFVPAHPRSLTVVGNRGASGIDGIISTSAGVSLASGRRVIAIVGDLALLHDSNGLASLRHPGVRVVVVVMNNDGGGIFHLLPIREFEPAFTPLFATPHGRDLSLLSAFHGLPHLDVSRESADELARAAESTPARVGSDLGDAWEEAMGWKGSGILEVRTDRDRNRIHREGVIEAISLAVGTATTTERG